MEINIYPPSDITTNECRKYWVFPTPLYAYKRYLPKSVSSTFLLARLDECLLILKLLVIPLETFIYSQTCFSDHLYLAITCAM